MNQTLEMKNNTGRILITLSFPIRSPGFSLRLSARHDARPKLTEPIRNEIEIPRALAAGVTPRRARRVNLNQRGGRANDFPLVPVRTKTAKKTTTKVGSEDSPGPSFPFDVTAADTIKEKNQDALGCTSVPLAYPTRPPTLYVSKEGNEMGRSKSRGYASLYWMGRSILKSLSTPHPNESRPEEWNEWERLPKPEAARREEVRPHVTRATGRDLPASASAFAWKLRESGDGRDAVGGGQGEGGGLALWSWVKVSVVARIQRYGACNTN
ncbi:hypothetical protein BC827DRAFT_1156053 [Russula dissimulans]|nr:hypothetical protein BC827DRAFT_1156053 [Russula dissimulans]